MTTFGMKPWNSRPAPLSKVVGYVETEDGPLSLLACGHSIPMELTDDIPLKGNEVGCMRCRDDAPIKADGALRGSL